MEATIDITPDLMAGFLDEASEHLEALNSHLMVFEGAAEAAPVRFDNDESREQMNTMFRAAHSLKGLSATFGFSDINRLTHTMETLFDQAREGKHSFDLATLETLLRCVDKLESLVGQLTDPSGQLVDVDAALAELQAIIDGGPAAGRRISPRRRSRRPPRQPRRRN